MIKEIKASIFIFLNILFKLVTSEKNLDSKAVVNTASAGG